MDNPSTPAAFALLGDDQRRRLFCTVAKPLPGRYLATTRDQSAMAGSINHWGTSAAILIFGRQLKVHVHRLPHAMWKGCCVTVTSNYFALPALIMCCRSFSFSLQMNSNSSVLSTSSSLTVLVQGFV
jgi:hypothetical protein